MPPPNTFPLLSVHRREPEFIKPATPTPHEFKPLSDIDDQGGLRFNISIAFLYSHNPSMRGKDPVKVIRDALAKTLVFYYPFAGRLREWPNHKLVVECNGEGIVFIEADADATLSQFGDSLQPPFPCFEEFLFDVPGTTDILNCPLLLVQVTRLKCGGLIFAIRHNHTMADGFGFMNFLSAVGELSQGASFPSVLPVWERHLLSARNPPIVTCTHKAYDPISDSNTASLVVDDLVHDFFFFGQAEIHRLRELIPPGFPHTTFELLTACVWKCRTKALQYNPLEETRMLCLTNIRRREDSVLPKGYYGNAFALSPAVATSRDVANKPFSYLVKLVKKAKAEVTMEHMMSLADLMKLKDKPFFTATGSYCVSDLTRTGIDNLDLGWGKPIYGGPTKGGDGPISGLISFYVPFKNNKGEKGIVVPISLPKQAMKRLEMELEIMVGAGSQIFESEKKYSKRIISAL